jgi:protein-L-isoaspartate(D-aspartate) O-methyltransferase
MMEDSGTVIGIEHIPELHSKCLENISKSHSELLKNKIVQIVEGDGREGYAEFAPYNCIHVGAGTNIVYK